MGDMTDKASNAFGSTDTTSDSLGDSYFPPSVSNFSQEMIYPFHYELQHIPDTVYLFQCATYVVVVKCFNS